jgi:hippurate hydrolase
MEKLIASYVPDLVALRRDLHQHPELGFEERRTSGIIAKLLESYGIEVHTGWAGTGVVGVLENGSSGDSIAIRADMDALALEETHDRAHRSVNDGVMHACGHDGHVAMLVGAARYLAETRKFDGKVVFLFQPAEEGGGGGRLMVQEGVIEKYNIQAAYSMHNRSSLDAGYFATRSGILMAATDNFEIVIHGEGAHAALPHTGIDPILTASNLVTALQSVVSREIPALDSTVLSVTQFISGTAFNIIPGEATLRGCTRYQDIETGILLREAMERTTSGICAAHGADYTFNYMPGYPPLYNSPEQTVAAIKAATDVAGKDKVDPGTEPIMASEDFSYFLEKVPGCYIFLGNGADTANHHPDYDFNDEIIPVGVAYWVKLVEQELAPGT